MGGMRMIAFRRGNAFHINVVPLCAYIASFPLLFMQIGSFKFASHLFLLIERLWIYNFLKLF